MARQKNSRSKRSNGGRPSKYQGIFEKQVEKLCLLGATDEEIADFFEVSVATINNWKKEHPEFLESIKKGKLLADANVANRLYERAMGYEHEEEKIFQFNGSIMRVDTVRHYPPDTTAAIFWLKNRQSKKWRDKHEVDANLSIPVVWEEIKTYEADEETDDSD